MEVNNSLAYSVYERMEALRPGSIIPVTGHKGHWYNQKSKIKRDYPDRKYKIYNDKGNYYCLRKF